LIANRLGVAPSFPVGLRDGESADIGRFRFTAVPAAHEELTPECLGYVIEFGRWRIYHSGDTLLYQGMADLLRPFNIDVALLTIWPGARTPRGGQSERP